VLQFELYVKCTGRKNAYSFIKFLMTPITSCCNIKADPSTLMSIRKQQLYMVPPDTKYAEIELKRFTGEGYIYADEFTAELNIGLAGLTSSLNAMSIIPASVLEKRILCINETLLMYSVK